LDKVKINVELVDERAFIPQYKTEGSAGFDFYAIEDVSIFPEETVLIRTGLKMAIPEGYEIQIRPRSGMSLKTKLRIANSPGTIDSDFRGEIQIIVENTGDELMHIEEGDRIAQGVLNKVPQAVFIEVDKLDYTERGEGGFGSTGTK